MKGKILTICTLCLVPVLIFSLAGCKKEAGSNSGYVLQDTNVYPAVSAPYESESKSAISEYLSVANSHLVKGEVDTENTEVQAAAKTAAAKLYAYACYNEEYIDKYVYFSDQLGNTDLGSLGSSTATKQDYKLIINKSDETEGYKYHYTIKNVDSAKGTVSAMKSAFESCKLRFVKDTNVLYRFSGSDVQYDVEGYLTCTWNVDNSDWGTQDNPIQKAEGDQLSLDGIADDIVAVAADNPSDAVVHGNINILADDIISSAYISEGELWDGGDNGYIVILTIDPDVANADEASHAMLCESNSSDDCEWQSLAIIFRVWDNGLFYSYTISELWDGSISGFSCSVSSTTEVTYSYSDRDTDITDKLAMLETAIESYGG